MANYNLEKIKKQFQYWLALGAVFTLLVTASFLNLIFNYSIPILWKLIGMGISVLVFWWYWVMSLIYQIIKIRNDEERTIEEMFEQIRELKYDIEKHYIQK
jgi:cellulose synthase/poly-beta-1,6-N-acetylglucosamine synthase-like glycosyltransferase